MGCDGAGRVSRLCLRDIPSRPRQGNASPAYTVRAARTVVETGLMMRRSILLVLALGCSGRSDECGQALPVTDYAGNPWPSYATASTQLADCAQLAGHYQRQIGACSDGKRFVRKGTGLSGDTLYFEGETVVGWVPWSDVIITCDRWSYGDTRCDEVDVREIVCPLGDAGLQ